MTRRQCFNDPDLYRFSYIYDFLVSLVSCFYILMIFLYLLFFLFYHVHIIFLFFFFFSSRRRHTRCLSDWSSDVCSSDLAVPPRPGRGSARPHGPGSPGPSPARIPSAAPRARRWPCPGGWSRSRCGYGGSENGRGAGRGRGGILGGGGSFKKKKKKKKRRK